MVQAIQQPQEEFPGHALPAVHEAGEELASKMEKLNLAFPVLPPLTPKTPVIGPLPKPAALKGFSQVEAKGLHSHLDSESKTDFDDPFEPEAEVKPFISKPDSLDTSCFRWISFPQATPFFCSISRPSHIPLPCSPNIILTPLLLPLPPSSQPRSLIIPTSTNNIITNILVPKLAANICLALRPVTSTLPMDPDQTLQEPSKTQRKMNLSISSMLLSGTLMLLKTSSRSWRMRSGRQGT